MASKLYSNNQSARAISMPDLDFDKRREKKEKKEEKFGNSKPWHFPEEMVWLVPI